jgi:hypothetical protein
VQIGGQQRNQRKQRQQARRGSGDGLLGPLPLRFHAQDNVAKSLMEFSVEISRERLRPVTALSRCEAAGPSAAAR